MYHEFKGSSNRNKAEKKRSGKKEGELALSPYQSYEDFAETDDGLGEVIEELTDKTASTRQNAANRIWTLCSQHTAHSAVASSVETILAACTKTLAAHKIAESEILGALRLGNSLMLQYGDDNVSLYNEWAAAVFGLVARSKTKASDAVVGACFGSLALMFSADDQLLVGDLPLASALHSLDITKPTSASSHFIAAYLPCFSLCCEVPQRRSLADLIRECLNNDDYEILVAAVEAVGIVETRFTSTFAAATVEPLLKLTTKEVGAKHKKPLLSLVRSVLEFLKEKSIPQETLSFRHQDVHIVDFANIYILNCLREAVMDGLQRQITSNPTVRRIFQVTHNFHTAITNVEKAQKQEERKEHLEEKRENLRERERERNKRINQKHSHNLGGDFE